MRAELLLGIATAQLTFLVVDDDRGGESSSSKDWTNTCCWSHRFIRFWASMDSSPLAV